jgi:peptide/nickel transport system permease protein
MVPVLLGVSFIIFTIMSLIPGDAAALILGEGAPMEAREQLNAELGLNDPYLVRYVRYIANALQGDFGMSYRTRQPVFEEIFARFPTTVLLAIGAMITAVAIALPIGVFSAVKQYSAFDMISSVSAMMLCSVPAFWLGLLSILLFALKLRWLPSNGADSIHSFILPILALSLPTAAELLRLSRSTMLETIRQDYVRTARAKGATERIVIWKHALKNALLPIVTVVGMHFGGQLGGSVIVESVFALPGVGFLAVTAIRSKDTPQVMASVLLLAVGLCFVMLLIDILYTVIDPRVRAKYSK